MTVDQLFTAFLTGSMTSAEVYIAMIKLGYNDEQINQNFHTISGFTEAERASWIAQHPIPGGNPTPPVDPDIPGTPADPTSGLFGERQDLSTTRGGRSEQFNRFVANRARNLSPGIQPLLQRQFDPLSAQFVLNQAVGNVQGENLFGSSFRDFLDRQPAPHQGRGFFDERFDVLQPLFQNQGGLSPEQMSSIGDISRDVTGRNVITQFLGSNLSPSARQFLPGVLQTRINAFLDTRDPGTEEVPGQSLFGEFLRRGRTF